MAMSTGGSKGGPTSEINMTPMIDVLLVLLIIFMVVQQGLQKGLSVQVPPVEQEAVSDAPTDQMVLEIKPGPQYLLNQQPIAPANLEAELQRIYAPRPRKVIFVKGEENISYGDVIHVVDATRAAGVEVVGLVPRT